jgi:cell wall-associated NlpC family hydrolase
MRLSVPLVLAAATAGVGTPAYAAGAKERASARARARVAMGQILRAGSTGPGVVRVQRLLGLRVTAVFDRATLDAVRRFQGEHHLLVDGQVGPHTWAALLAEDRGFSGELVLQFGSTGPAVAALQRALHVTADGDFGPITLGAVKAFQRSHGLVVDGQAGEHTLGALHLDLTGVVASHPTSHRHVRHRTHTVSANLGERAAELAHHYLGVRYVWGGESTAGFDCSGLVQYVYAQLGVSIPRTTYEQYNAGTHISRADLRPGDLVFFDHIGHVGIFIGHGQFIHAPHTGTVVQVGTLTGWYAETYDGAVQVW